MKIVLDILQSGIKYAIALQHSQNASTNTGTGAATDINIDIESESTGNKGKQTTQQTESTSEPQLPDLRYLKDHFEQAIQSFYATLEQIKLANPVDMTAFLALAAKAAAGSLTDAEAQQFDELKLAAQRQGRAVGAVSGFFLKYRPYPMLAEIREKEAVFQPVFGPVLVASGDAVRDVLSRHEEFTVDPYGAEMSKSMSSKFNGGFDTFILSTDNNEKYIEDKQLLTSVVTADDPQLINELIHRECMSRVKQAVNQAREQGHLHIDVVTAVARFVPVVLGHHYLGVPVVEQRGSFQLTENMLSYYGDRVAGPDGVTPLPTRYQRPDGTLVDLPDSALGRNDGVIPDELTVYHWIVSAFQHFFNNVQKDIEVQAKGVRAYRELLVYLLREIDIQRQLLNTNPNAVADTLLTRLLKIQLGISAANGIDLKRVSDLRIAENVMGTIVGAVAGQEEATCRVIDSMIRLQEGDFKTKHSGKLASGQCYGSFEKARELALNVLKGHDVKESRSKLYQYVSEALRLQPQGEVLLRVCVREGATIDSSRPLRAGTLIFVGHGSAMQDMPSADSFITGRDSSAYLQFGSGRHKCLGQYVSPVLMCEALIALLALHKLHRPEPDPGETAFPHERRFGRFQLDDNNLYAKTFTLAFEDSGNTRKYFGQEAV